LDETRRRSGCGAVEPPICPGPGVIYRGRVLARRLGSSIRCVMPIQSDPRPFELPAPPAVLLGKYRLTRTLGSGGMGVVYEAHHDLLGIDVAIKVLRPELAPEQHGAARLLNEARAAARIESEHIVRVLDVGVLENGIPFLVMDRLYGQDFEKLLKGHGPLSIRDAVDYLLEALVAVGAAHSAGIIHRDLKPSNLFLAEKKDGSNVVKVLDFGIAKRLSNPAESWAGAITTTGSVMGSPAYMAPEQLRAAKQVDGRADIWATGVILYELLTGKSPFLRSNAFHVLTAVLEDNPPPPGTLRREIPPQLESAILRCLKRDPNARFPHALGLAEVLAPFGGRRAELALARLKELPPAPPIANARDEESEPTISSDISSPGGTRDAKPVAAEGDTTQRVGYGTIGDAVIRPSPPKRLSWSAIVLGCLAVAAILAGIGKYWAPRSLPSRNPPAQELAHLATATGTESLPAVPPSSSVSVLLKGVVESSSPGLSMSSDAGRAASGPSLPPPSMRNSSRGTQSNSSIERTRHSAGGAAHASPGAAVPTASKIDVSSTGVPAPKGGVGPITAPDAAPPFGRSGLPTGSACDRSRDCASGVCVAFTCQ